MVNSASAEDDSLGLLLAESMILVLIKTQVVTISIMTGNDECKRVMNNDRPPI